MKRIIYYRATIKRTSGRSSKKEDLFLDSFPALEGLKTGVITDSLVLGYLKMTKRFKQGETYKIVELERIKDLGKSFYYQ